MSIKVAFYIRVSTDTEDQLNSLENQKQACFTTLQMHPEYELVKIYCDEGISGTQAKKRPGFMEMISDAEAGKIDLIITKSLSRWSRNTIECLTYIKEMQKRGVNFIFEREGIDTRDSYSEFALTIYSAFSQEESRSISENTKSGIRMRNKLGKDRWTRVYGYEKGYIIKPDEAKVIQRIFDLYEEGMTIAEVSRCLNNEGIKSPSGKMWQSKRIDAILRNEKYAGDIETQKSFVEDHITHRSVKNNGQLEKYYISNHYTPIIRREQFERVNNLLRKRTAMPQYDQLLVAEG